MRFAVVLALVDTAAAVVFQHALIWRKSKMIEMTERNEYAAFVNYRNDLRSSSLITASQMVLPQEGYVYIGNITIGTPDQQFTVLIDTGSAILWVPGTGCEHKFNKKASSTFVRTNITWRIIYGVGMAAGYYGIDVVRFGGLNEQQLVVPNTEFGLAMHIARFSHNFNDGMLGLAPYADGSKSTSPIMSAINQSLLDEPVFTVWFKNKAMQGTNEGLFTYGGVDTKNCGPPIAYEPLISQTHYTFKISAVGMGYFTQTKVYEGVSDTGTTFLEGPKPVIDQFVEIAGAVAGTGQCFLAIGSLDYAGFTAMWILGRPFIHEYCNIYNIGQKLIGFAPSF